MTRLVIFDRDGVLVDSEAISNTVLARMLTAEGLPTTPAQSRRRYQGLLLADIVLHAQALLGRSLPAGWAERYEVERDAAFEAELRPVTHAAEAVEAVSAAGLYQRVSSSKRSTNEP